MSSWTPTTYKTRNWVEYNQSLKQRGSLSIWFDPEMTWEAEASGRRGRQQTYSDAASQACLTLMVLFDLPLRQTTGVVESLLERVGLNWSVPDFSTLCRRQRTLSVATPCRGSAGRLHLLIDSTGIKAEGEGEWNARKHGGSKRRLWRKIHIGIDEETLEIRAIEVTSSRIGDAPMLPDLLSQTYSARYRQMRTSAVSPRTVPMIHANATTSLQPERPMPSYRRARMRKGGRPIHQGHVRATKPCEPQSTWVVPCGET